MKNSRVQEPNVETDHLESSTSGSVNLLNQSFDTIGSNLPGKMSAGPEGMHFFIKWSKTNQMGRCVQRQRQAHVSSSSNGGHRECCHCSTHSSPLFHFKDGRTLTSKSFRSTFLPLVWWSYVATIQPNITPTLVQPCTVAARIGLPTDTIWNLGRGEAKHTRHTYWCSHSTCKL